MSYKIILFIQKTPADAEATAVEKEIAKKHKARAEAISTEWGLRKQFKIDEYKDSINRYSKRIQERKGKCYC